MSLPHTVQVDTINYEVLEISSAGSAIGFKSFARAQGGLMGANVEVFSKFRS